MASKKKEELLQPDVQTQAQPAAQSTYSTEGLDSRTEVEKAMANASYRPSQQVTDAANALKQWQQNRPADYQSSYQDRINELLGQLLERENFQYSYTRDPLYRQYEQLYTLHAHNASADAAAQAAALTGGYGSSYATSAAQQAYQQQIGGLASAIPALYSLALDTYQSGGEELVTRLEQLNGQEQNAQSLYDRQLQDYYTQLQQKGDAYNAAYAKDYGQYQEHLNRLDTLHGYYTAQEQAQISQRQQAFNNVMTVLGGIGDVVQLAISGTTGLGSLAGSLLNTGYNIYSGNRAYEAERADTQWSQQMQEKQRQDALTQQQYDNTASERAYQDALKQQAFNNNVTSQKLNIAKGEWALKQSNAQQKAAQAAGKAAAAGTKSGSSGSSGKATGSSTPPPCTTAGRSTSAGKYCPANACHAARLWAGLVSPACASRLRLSPCTASRQARAFSRRALRASGALAGLPPFPLAFLPAASAAASQSCSSAVYSPSAGRTRGVPALTSRAIKWPSPP